MQTPYTPPTQLKATRTLVKITKTGSGLNLKKVTPKLFFKGLQQLFY